MSKCICNLDTRLNNEKLNYGNIVMVTQDMFASSTVTIPTGSEYDTKLHLNVRFQSWVFEERGVPFITINPRSTLTRIGSTCQCVI